ncbi:hypothetical protein Gorai_002420 [Gossypium raimondii]|uniref:Transposase MuDR plant domain-containing protein n=1 Tax=Gossypium raimondii TaxID=29730 RepID=A0A7J8QKY5_GOSRA|nr:hypothetical protein [Gossypium raimondii]
MLDFWVKFKEIHLYVEHEVDNPIIVDDILLLTVGESDVEGVEADEEGDVERVNLDEDGVVEGVQVVREGVEVYEEGDIEGIQADGEGDVEGVQAEADEYGGGKSDGVDNVATAFNGEEEDENETEVWDLNEHGNLVGSNEDEEHEDGERRRSKFPLYNDWFDLLKFSLEMLFKDSKQFKSTIRNYSKECRRQLKFLKNEPKKGCCEVHCFP